MSLDIELLRKAIKEQGFEWRVEYNHLTGMDTESRKKLLGSIPPEAATATATDPRVSELIGSTDNLPTSIDWRNNGGNFVSNIQNQGRCGSCVSFGSVAVFESMIAIEKGMFIKLSEADGFFCSSHGANCSGWWPSSFFKANQTRGICQAYLFPYSSAFSNGNPSCKVNPKRDSNAFKYQNINSVTTIDEAKAYLVNVGPITACFDVYEDFYHYKSGVYKHTTGEYEGIHCISVIGYSNDNGGYWICKNSWGDNWGMNGYFYIAFNECNIDVNSKVGVSSVLIPENVYANIGSVAFPNVYLRLDGTGVTKFSGPGGGTVNCQYGAATYEQFLLARNTNDKYTIGSIEFPNVFLRMNGSGVTKPTAPGGGIVNCQYTAHSWEHYTITQQGSCEFTIGSNAFPNVFLRMDGSGVTQPMAPGGGTVNCQYTAGSYEHYRIINASYWSV